MATFCAKDAFWTESQLSSEVSDFKSSSFMDKSSSPFTVMREELSIGGKLFLLVVCAVLLLEVSDLLLEASALLLP